MTSGGSHVNYKMALTINQCKKLLRWEITRAGNARNKTRKKKMSNWFSNFLPFDEPFAYQNISYPTPEHFFQAMKSKDVEERKKVSLASTPKQAKHLGYKVKLREDWEEIKLKVMMTALKYKFSPGTSWYEKLKNCTGEIVEWNYWHDNFWGHCLCSNCQNKEHKNYLGRMLSQLRSKIWTQN